ncbi:DUF6501 family protein [Bacillus thermotolerans]|mgnify:CR=1 FL=1|uniref:Uncharacterized protein n=1 Tax=Bacillus thermotolerans TaxID=1221996 RepID=A0A0F5HQ25_BACTR|nr:DUF6501 family protein [Bacillus thermotolerans]KKB35421.1 hypothetical protein QY97_01713 [Bacillus thermotolerans]KKB39025.1 hypothetical protein QY95_02465 [Bacillus thermotolerans]KKB40878.1 hypothetical protein QY96_02256 [Bacillus thermotolerans]
MNHLQWKDKEPVKQVVCLHTNAKKYMVENRLTPEKVYDVKNETEEFYFVVDDKGKISGFYKDYFKEATS